MKKKEAFPGKYYVVTSPNGCTVTAKSGKQLGTVEAGQQGGFTAIDSAIEASDDEAEITQVFKLAPQQRLALLGVLGGVIPAWFKALREELTAMLDGSAFELAWLASKKKLVVHTDRVDDAMLAAVKATAEAAMPATATLVQYNHNMEISWRDINKYAECENTLDIYAVDPEKNAQGKDVFPHFTTYDLTSDGEWVYPLPNLKSSGTDESGYIFGINNKLTRLYIYAPKCTRWVCGAQVCSRLEIVEGNLEAVTDAYYGFASCLKLKSCTLRFPKLRGNNLNMFRDCILDKPSAVGILDSIPAYASGSHKLTIGIHVDHQTDDDVLAAIANAEAKGWALSVIWNGTPTAQAATTYGLRKPPIYARMSERELPDGTVEHYLDWGHYVTDPTGYEEFRSVEAAREYYGLSDEPLTETE